MAKPNWPQLAPSVGVKSCDDIVMLCVERDRLAAALKTASREVEYVLERCLELPDVEIALENAEHNRDAATLNYLRHVETHRCIEEKT